MARSSAQIKITGIDQMALAMKEHDQKVKRAMAFEFKRAEPLATSYAKKNAPWTDRSGNARAGLHAKARSIDAGNAFDLTMAHSVFYGIFLETRWSGKYAILLPTINYIGKILMQRIESRLGKLGDTGVPRE
ncbi:hypothetical protein SEA_WEISS13_20 [Mycobacterium phage Weiss13]|uniref:Uncharacterized protein n=1 Tax=Mycobacterium phage Weiss13 TaxID=1784843 RepID=A0A120HUJ5_9CAUD|nr:hypothetical protein SEA_WEISS13_20 [Mycobacterium phage Weiss13]